MLVRRLGVQGAGQMLGAREACVGRAGGSWAKQGLGAERAGALQARGARGRSGRRAGDGRQGAAEGTGARGAGLAGRQARGLGTRAGLELCTRCTRPVFGPVRLCIFLSQIFWTLFVNPVHEHRSARIFSKKKKLKYLKKIN